MVPVRCCQISWLTSVQLALFTIHGHGWSGNMPLLKGEHICDSCMLHMLV